MARQSLDAAALRSIPQLSEETLHRLASRKRPERRRLSRRQRSRYTRAKGDIVMKAIARRPFLFLAAAAPMALAAPTWAQAALPDARFVGFAQVVNDFLVSSGNLALARSTNDNVRGYASRAIAEANSASQSLRSSRSEAGVSYAPDGAMGQRTANLMAQLNALQGPQFDTAFANAQLSIMTDTEAQYGAFSQGRGGGPLRRYAQVTFPKMQMLLEYAKRLAGGR